MTSKREIDRTPTQSLAETLVVPADPAQQNAGELGAAVHTLLWLLVAEFNSAADEMLAEALCTAIEKEEHAPQPALPRLRYPAAALCGESA